MKKDIQKENYTESILFEVRLTSRYLSIAGNLAFEKLNPGISFENYIILDILSYNEGICNSDLAKMLLRDRSNTGKIVSNLEKSGFIEVRPDIRNNRTVKTIFLTEKGKNIRDEVYPKLAPYIEIFNGNFTESEKKSITNYMRRCRELLGNIAENKI